MATLTEFRSYLVCAAIKEKKNIIYSVYFLFQYSVYMPTLPDDDVLSEIGLQAIKNAQI